MVSKTVIQELCDIHWHADNRVETDAVFEQRVAIEAGTWRKLQWCEECNKTERTIDDTLRLFRDFGVVEPTSWKPTSPRKGTKHAKNYQCPYCPRKYSRKPSFDDHVAGHTGEVRDLPYKCTIEGCRGKKDGSKAEFATPQQLGSHKLSVHQIAGVTKRS